jgi:competence ComEA-like helix-hairpin-helix protein
MRKPNVSMLLIITMAFAAFTLGFFFGRNRHEDVLSISVSDNFFVAPSEPPEAIPEVTEITESISFPISINQASKEELMALPGIGDVLADRILTYREKNGDFSRPEDLLNVEGIGKKRFEEMLDLISIGG